MIQFALILLFSIVISAAIENRSHAQEKVTGTLTLEDIMNREIVYKVPEMKEVQRKKDISYKSTSDGDLRMDVYLPKGVTAEKRVPAVIFVHGGVLSQMPKLPKDWGFFNSYGELLAASGFAAVTFNHRTLGMPPSWDTGREDVEAAFQHVLKNSESYHIDPNSIAVWIFSAGGPYVSLFLGNENIKAVVCYYSILELSSFEKTHPESWKRWHDLSPVSALSKANRIPPLFLVRAGLDTPGMNGTMEAFLKEALSRNSGVRFINYPQGHHGFDLADDTDESREIIRETLQFLHVTMK